MPHSSHLGCCVCVCTVLLVILSSVDVDVIVDDDDINVDIDVDVDVNVDVDIDDIVEIVDIVQIDVVSTSISKLKVPLPWAKKELPGAVSAVKVWEPICNEAVALTWAPAALVTS